MVARKEKEKKKEMSQAMKEAIGIMAGSNARQSILDACAKVGLTVEKTAKTVVAAMDAKRVQAQLDLKGEWKISPPMTDHVTRLKAVEHAEVLLDLKPVDRKKVDVVSALSDEEIDAQLKHLLG
jgi:hypothetical protein